MGDDSSKGSETSIQDEEGTPYDWDASGGYTPLTDMTLLNGAAYLDSGDDEQEGVMFSEGPSHPTTAEIIAENDYLAVANQALASLEADYLATLRLEKNREETASPITEKKTIEREFSEQAEVSQKQTEDAIGDFVDETFFASEASKDGPVVIPEKREQPAIDTEAVRKAVGSIQLKNPQLTSALETWEEESKSRTEHALIPKAPLAAFWKKTSKAIASSANLSRSATIAEALVRLDLLQKQKLIIHVVGCDHVECETEERIRTYFGPIVRWLRSSSATNSIEEVHLDLIGPGVPVSAAKRPDVDLMPSKGDGIRCATASCHAAVYDDWLEPSSNADLIIAFNAGVWGYNEWKTTIQVLVKRKRAIPFVVTSYTLFEAEDDEEVIQEEVSKDCARLWGPETNPYSSRVVRPTKSAKEGRIYHENNAWQAWKL